MDLATESWSDGRFLCVGLDPDFEAVSTLLPDLDPVQRQLEFNREIVDHTIEVAGAYKPNSAFYEARGADGVATLRDTIRYIHELEPNIPVILDAKRGDIGNTNRGYVEYAFDYLKADAITIHP
ncbi:MAG: orotidine 5'-phosphate decarboxylase / HUMPS family protein [Acidimicrobiia bacterium]|nr:orotidine 5'-phosphate decarboxylase / HUMPS family protein [Acidimicrobiia bacterium]